MLVFGFAAFTAFMPFFAFVVFRGGMLFFGFVVFAGVVLLFGLVVFAGFMLFFDFVVFAGFVAAGRPAPPGLRALRWLLAFVPKALHAPAAHNCGWGPMGYVASGTRGCAGK